MRASLDGEDPVRRAAESLTSDLRAVLSVDRAAKSFLYNIGRTRTPAQAPAPLSAPTGRARNWSFQGSPSHAAAMLSNSSGHPETYLSRSMFGLADGSDYTTFEKCICLKGSQLMKNLDDDKVSLAAQLARVITLAHGDTLYADGAVADSVFVVLDGTIAITQQLSTASDAAVVRVELRDGDCFGEEVRVSCWTSKSVLSPDGVSVSNA